MPNNPGPLAGALVPALSGNMLIASILARRGAGVNADEWLVVGGWWLVAGGWGPERGGYADH